MRAILTLEKFDRDLNLVCRREIPSRSFLLNSIKLLYVMHSRDALLISNIDGTDREVNAAATFDLYSRGWKANLMIASKGGYSHFWCLPGHRVNLSAHRWQYMEFQSQLVGVQVGTGPNVVTLADHKLQTRIAHGNGAGQLEYSGCEVLAPTFSDPGGEMIIRRYFNNNSGGLITVNEAGIYAVGGRDWSVDGRLAWAFCIARDLVAPGVDVADTEMLRLTYMIQITV